MERNEATPGVSIERGKIVEIQGDRYVVESYTKGGVKTRPIEAVNKYVNEYEGQPPKERKYDEYLVGDSVYFFMFGDGRGMILGKMVR